MGHGRSVAEEDAEAGRRLAFLFLVRRELWLLLVLVLLWVLPLGHAWKEELAVVCGLGPVCFLFLL